MFERTLRLPVSMRDIKVFLKLLQLDLASNPPGAPVTKIWILAEPAPPRSAQRGLFLPITPEAEKLEITLARIKAIIGERRAGVVRFLDSHRPESFRLDRFSVPADGPVEDCHPTLSDRNGSSSAGHENVSASPSASGSIIGRPSHKSGARDKGKLVAENWAEAFSGRRGHGALPANGGRSFPSPTNDGQTGSWDREEWDIAILCTGKNAVKEKQDSVALYRIYRDLATGRWFADASYD